MRVAPAISLSDAQRRELERLIHSNHTEVRLVRRSNIILFADQGLQDKEIALKLDIDRKQVARCRKRYLEAGVNGLKRDRPRTVKAPKVGSFVTAASSLSVVEGMEHWSARKMGSLIDQSANSYMEPWFNKTMPTQEASTAQECIDIKKTAA